MKKYLLTPVLVLALMNVSRAQLTVSEETNDTTFVYSLAGPGVFVSNISRTCASGASGFFNSTSANVGIDSGIVLTSGSILGTLGPNNLSSTSTANGYPGDADLDAVIAPSYTYDACIIEFDMTVASDTLKLNYVFGSEEYLEFVGSFNDVFAFWVSGPGITGTVNIATVPGTTVPISINDVNDASYPMYFVNNGDGLTDPYMSDPYYVQYDGLTTVLLATTPVTAGETYHMKIAVADASDGIYDTGVFLKTGSLGSLRLGSSTYGEGDALTAEENCSNGYIKFTRYVVGNFDLVLNYYIAGTAENGIDYEEIPSEITIPANDSSATLVINPISDGSDETDETITLYLYNPESGYVYDSVTMMLKDEINADFFYSSADLTANFVDNSDVAVSWLWDFGDGTTSTEQNPSHTYTTSGTYTACLTTTNANGCSSQTCKQVSFASAVDNISLAEQIKVYPNPATDIIHVEIPQQISGNTTISIKNILNEIMYSTQTNTNIAAINISDFAKGIYILELNTKEGIIVKSFEKK